jgi:hypothetical protein
MTDYHAKKRQCLIWEMQVDWILDNREIPERLLMSLGLKKIVDESHGIK